MKTNDSNNALKGARKAAALLLTMGKEEAAQVLSHLDDKMIEQIVLEMTRIKAVPKDEKDKILKEFSSTIEEVSREMRGGIDTAKEILSRSLGEDRAEEVIQKVNKRDMKKDFEFLNDIDPYTIAALIGKEAPQTIAVTISHLGAKKAAEVLKLLPRELQSQIALRLATTSKSHPDAVANIARVLRKKYESRDELELTTAGGVQSLAEILNHMDKNIESNILQDLSETSPELANTVRDKLYAFEDLLDLNQKEMRTLINRLGGNELLIAALRGAGDELRQHFFNAMSQNRAVDIIEEMDARGKLTLREIMQARSEILNIARDLELEGFLVIKKKGEEYI